MFDIKWICKNPRAFDAGLAKRKYSAQANKLIELDENRRKAQQVAQEIQSKRNSLSIHFKFQISLF